MTIKSNINASVLKKLEAISGKKLTLGSLLLAIRQGEELTQVEFSKLLGISKQYLCDLEHGRRYASPKAASDYAKKLGYNHLQFVRLCLQDMVDRDGIALHVDVKAA
jgi:DNA-binding XRE family transcriptional regulator